LSEKRTWATIQRIELGGNRRTGADGDEEEKEGRERGSHNFLMEEEEREEGQDFIVRSQEGLKKDGCLKGGYLPFRKGERVGR